MDRNSIIGLSLIGLILVAYSIFTQPSKEELVLQQHKRDSVELVRKQTEAQQTKVIVDTNTVAPVYQNDSAKAEHLRQELGDFASAANGTEQLITLENKKIRVILSSVGGKVKSAELKDYKTWDGKPVLLFNNDSSVFNLSLSAQNRIINTEKLFFNA